MIKRLSHLDVFTNSYQLAMDIFQMTRKFPKEEKYSLIDQVVRSSRSITANIAEGCGRSSNAEFNRFLTIASGSAAELHYHLILSKDLFYISPELFTELETTVIEIKKMLYSFSQKLF